MYVLKGRVIDGNGGEPLEKGIVEVTDNKITAVCNEWEYTLSLIHISLSLCTRGESGAWLADGKTVYRQRPYLVEARDTMAAGDSFLTCFLVNYLNESQKNPGGHEACLLYTSPSPARPGTGARKWC